MKRNVYALKRALVALGYGSSVEDFSGHNVVSVLKELAVIAGAAPSVSHIRTISLSGILNFIADNKGEEENEPYDLSVSATDVSVEVQRGSDILEPQPDILYKGDQLKITAEVVEGKELASLTVDGQDFTSGDTFIVRGGNVSIVATAQTQTFDLARTATDCTVTVTRNGNEIADGSGVLSYGDQVVISAAATEGYELASLQVNGEEFTSGNTFDVSENVEIVATATPKFSLSRVATGCTVSVIKDGSEIADGTQILSQGDVLTITATAEAGKTMSLLDVNGQPFTSGDSLTVSDDILIMANAN